MITHYKQLSFIAHNHSYDLGLVLTEMKQGCNIKIHVKQALNFYSANTNNLSFIDSCAFMSASLSSLVKTYIDTGNHWLVANTLSSIYHLKPQNCC